MSPQALQEELVGLAETAGFEVRRSTGSLEDDQLLPVGSGVCRLRGVVWVVLTPGEPVEEQNAVLAAALREHATSLLESRYLVPALREYLGV